MQRPKNKIGIVSVYFHRGAGHIAIQCKEAFQKQNYDIAILARTSVTDNQKRINISGEFFHSNVYCYPTYQIRDEDFELWIKRNELKKIIFIEEHFTTNLIGICNRLNVESYNYVVWENINPGNLDYYKKFTKLICPIKCTYNYLQNAELSNICYIPWGIDVTKKFPYQEPVKKDKIQFLFLDGWGGVYSRKNEESVINAFSSIVPRGNTTLRIHTQKGGTEEHGQHFVKTYGTITHRQILELYQNSDIVIIPSKWEGNGLGFYEASSCGRPVITINKPPMNEHISPYINGLLCDSKEYKTYLDIYVKAILIDEDDLAKKMLYLSENKKLLEMLCISSRQYAQNNFDWYKNSSKLVKEVME